MNQIKVYREYLKSLQLFILELQQINYVFDFDKNWFDCLFWKVLNYYFWLSPSKKYKYIICIEVGDWSIFSCIKHIQFHTHTHAQTTQTVLLVNIVTDQENGGCTVLFNWGFYYVSIHDTIYKSINEID